MNYVDFIDERIVKLYEPQEQKIFDILVSPGIDDLMIKRIHNKIKKS